jgi:hypothetical protein
MKRIIVWLGLFLLIGGLATAYFLFWHGYSSEELRAKFGPRYEAKKQLLKRIAEQLPPPGTIEKMSQARNLDPLPVYDAKSETYNIEGAMIEQLLNTDLDPQMAKNLDPLLPGVGLMRRLRLISPNYPYGSGVRVSGKALQDYEAALNLPYLVVVRSVAMVSPRPISKELYTPGYADLEVFLIDLRTEKVVASCQIRAESADNVSAIVSHKQSDGTGEVAGAARFSMVTDARNKLAPALREMTGGTFIFH